VIKRYVVSIEGTSRVESEPWRGREGIRCRRIGRLNLSSVDSLSSRNSVIPEAQIS